MNSSKRTTPGGGKTMSLKELFEIAEKGGNTPEGVSSDKSEAFVYMDVTSKEYRQQVSQHRRK